MQAGDVIGGRYQIAQQVGSGAMGEVYQAIDQHQQQTVAIKAIRPEIAAQNPELQRRFMREGRVLNQLDHPHIVKVLDIVEDSGDDFIVMEYVNGNTLSYEIKSRQRLGIKASIQIAYALSGALAYIHSQNILHRDIKPSNVMFTERRVPKIMDFGVAYLGGATSMTAPGSVLGTVSYIAPEVIYGEAHNERSDVWSLGMTIFKMVTGVLPFTGKTPAIVIADILTKPVPNLLELRPDAPPALVGLVDMMLQKELAARIDSMERVHRQLYKILNTL